jgi:hypothetical protein
MACRMAVMACISAVRVHHGAAVRYRRAVVLMNGKGLAAWRLSP